MFCAPHRVRTGCDDAQTCLLSSHATRVANSDGEPSQSKRFFHASFNDGSLLDSRATTNATVYQRTRCPGTDIHVRRPGLNSQFWTAPNQLTLLRLIFIPFVIICVLDANWRWALVLIIAAGLSDGLDGLLARVLNQRTMLGQYLDPIADKMLLSSLFLVLSFVKKIPWKYTVAVFGRDALIVATCVVLYAAVGFRDFRPSIFGKINTVCQIAAVFFVILGQVVQVEWVGSLQKFFLYATFVFTTISGVHYVLVTGHRLRKMEHRPVQSA